MAGILNIDKGTPHWWLSPDIWVTLVGDPTTPPGTGNPVAGQPYQVSVRVHDKYSEPVKSGWNLYVCWAIPTVGPIPIPPPAQVLSNAVIPPVSATSSLQVEAATTWTPVFENGGHECLIAMAYNEQAIGFPGGTTLDGNAPDTQVESIAQKNLGVVQVKRGGKAPFHYAFQVCNGENEEGHFVIKAQHAPLSDIAAFLPGMPGGRSILEKPGKFERLGITASAKPGAAGSEATAEVKIARLSCHPFTLSGVLEEGNALVHVTQSLKERVVGGLSVLVMAV
jgi:hypothetical protein